MNPNSWPNFPPRLACELLPLIPVTWLALTCGALAANSGMPSAPLRTAIAVPLPNSSAITADGYVEAVRQSVLSTPVQGTLTSLTVQVGDRVQAGQVLARIDARAAQQAGKAGDAQVQVARASLDVARRTLTRQRDLHAKGFISVAALEQAEAEFAAAEAGLNAQMAQAGVAHAQTDFHVIRAPYAGIVSEVAVVLGDLAQPGRPLITLFDPMALRVTAMLPQSDSPAARTSAGYRIEIAGRPAMSIPVSQGTLLPATDPGSQTIRLRLALPLIQDAPAPGTFARVVLSSKGSGATVAGVHVQRIVVPREAVVRRAEMTGVYVVRDGVATLRQVRLGAPAGAVVEVLSGVMAGEVVALDPQAAARHRLP